METLAMIDGHDFDAEFDEVEEKLLALVADNRAKIELIRDYSLDVSHGGGLARARYLLERQQKLASCLKVFVWLTSD